MLEEIEVNGFRSLRDFHLKMAPGLNILVGPNGAGKTNIISFFEFLSQLSDYDVSDAIHRIGGVASVLHRTSFSSVSEISFRIMGNSRHASAQSGESRLIAYEYTATIVISEELSDIFFSRQTLRLRNVRYSEQDDRDIASHRWDLEIESYSDGEEYSVEITRLDMRKLSVLVSPRFGYDREAAIQQLTRNVQREDINRMSLIAVLDVYFTNLRSIRNDLRSGEVYNVLPGSVKTREDISTPVGVQPDGSGTAATLLALSRLSARARNVVNYAGGPATPAVIQRPRYRLVPNAFLDIKKLMSLVNNSIEDISVNLDSIDGFIKIIFHIHASEGPIEVPLQRMSDGTVKWLALVTAIRTNRSMFAVEEPENYLHPYMQKEIIGIIRNSFTFGRAKSFALISTHSETLLNAVRPEEVIVVAMTEGRTRAERPKNISEINNIISETGFGLGSIYVGGGLDDA